MTFLDQETDVLRRMTPARKLALLHALIRQAYALELLARTRTIVGGDCP